MRGRRRILAHPRPADFHAIRRGSDRALFRPRFLFRGKWAHPGRGRFIDIGHYRFRAWRRPAHPVNISKPARENAGTPAVAAPAKIAAGLAAFQYFALRSRNATRSAAQAGKGHLVRHQDQVLVPPASIPRSFPAPPRSFPGSRAEVGSSNSNRRGWMATARAMATRCFWPPLKRRRFFVRMIFQLKRRNVSRPGFPPPPVDQAMHLLQRQHDIRQSGKMGEKVESLEDNSHPPPISSAAPPPRAAKRFRHHERTVPVSARSRPARMRRQGRFAAAARPDQHQRADAIQLERDIVQHAVPSKLFVSRAAPAS